jgi:hypothetical protein
MRLGKSPMSTLEIFEANGSHYQVGLAIGQHFAAPIQRSLAGYAFLQEQLRAYHRRPHGQTRYRELVRLHRSRCPQYMAELEGMAQGADCAFEDLFLVNLRGAYRGYLRQDAPSCFDCAVRTDSAALIGHNEDGAQAFQNNLYVIRARVDGQPAFTALSYPGFLCGNAFGYNAKGICFAIDNVRPLQVEIGIGRHFLARSLLEAHCLDDAIARVTVSDRASGFGYTIGSVPERRMVYVEVAPGAHHVREIQSCYVHANHYRELAGVTQIIDASSQARLERAEAIVRRQAPQDAAGVLAILGDQDHPHYPIHRAATPPDRLVTLCTALFDLDARRLRIYTSHPARVPNDSVEFKI